MPKTKRIISRDNRRLVHARRVRDGREAGQIFIEGRRLAVEALRSDTNIHECFVSEDLIDRSLFEGLAGKGIEIAELPAPVFRSIAATETPQGIVLIADRPSNALDLSNSGVVTIPVYVFLHEINNPSNLGAILRSVEASGAGGVFISRRSADAFSPKSLRASMGSAFRVRIAENADLDDVIDRARKAGMDCLAVDTDAELEYFEVDWKKPRLLVFGSEAHGITEREMKGIGGGINIPMASAVESLNLAVAAGIVLFEARRQVTARS